MKTKCPCTIADEPCQPHCTCIHGSSSYGCLCCATYGGEEQRKAAANRLVQLSRQQLLQEKGEDSKRLELELKQIGQNLCGINWDTEKEITVHDVYFFVEGEIEKQSDLKELAEGRLHKLKLPINFYFEDGGKLLYLEVRLATRYTSEISPSLEKAIDLSSQKETKI